MDLATFWFIVIAVLWTGYFVLEGFDFGVGMLLPVLGGKRYTDDPADGEKRRRVLLNTIGPVWDGNEVWVLTAGGATFEAARLDVRKDWLDAHKGEQLGAAMRELRESWTIEKR